MKVIEDQFAFSTSELVSIGASKNTLDSGAKRQRKKGGLLYTNIKLGKECFFYYDWLPDSLQAIVNNNFFRGKYPKPETMLAKCLKSGCNKVTIIVNPDNKLIIKYSVSKKAKNLMTIKAKQTI